jgi:dTDP-glucose 4,6-dehydratase/UDP-glucuronate decarboxylase
MDQLITASRNVVDEDLADLCTQLTSEFSELAGRRLLITGGAGFLGYYLVQAVIRWNARQRSAPIKLVVHDNFIRGVPCWLERLDRTPNLTITRRDATSPLAHDTGAFDYLIHAASIASPTYYRRYPLETLDANVLGLRVLLDYCRDLQAAGCAPRGILYFSSSEIYGDPPAHAIPTPETYPGQVSPTGPRACYDESKRFGETLCVTYARQFGLPVTIVRPFNNFGPGLAAGDRRVIPDFARDVLSGKDIELLSDGRATRTFCYVADAVAGYYKLLVHGRRGEAYNVGSAGPEITIGELADRIAALARNLFDYQGSVRHGASEDREYLTDNPQRRAPVISKAWRDVGYAPRIGLDEGLMRALLWYRFHPDGQWGTA